MYLRPLWLKPLRGPLEVHSVCVRECKFLVTGPPHIRLRWAGFHPPWARGKLGSAYDALTKQFPDRQAEVGDHFGHPYGVQATALSSNF